MAPQEEPRAEAVAGGGPSNETSRVVRLTQLLLDPRGLHALMGGGGGMLALGLVIWLAVIGVFDNPVIAATGLGVSNLALLGGGVWVAANTRYRLAGRGTAMLACLLLPLNLWFYDAQGLVTLADGGNLWVPALVCCVIYAAVAGYLKDSLFVYAIAGGVALTGLVFLADGDIGRFWEVLAPSTLLVSLGVACIHAERLFPVTQENDSNQAFTRDDFGVALFRAGHALLASGLGVLLAGRLAGRYYTAVFSELGWFVEPDVTAVTGVKLAAAALAATGAYAYVYSRVVRGGERFTMMATVASAWVGVIALELFGVGVVGTLFALTAAGFVAVATGRGMDKRTVATAGRVTVLLGGAAGGLLAANRVFGDGADSVLLLFTAGQAVLAAATAALTRREDGRAALVAMTVALTLVGGGVLHAISVLGFGQKLELFATVAGFGLLAAGLVGWRREAADDEGRREGAVDANLWLGSLLAAAPMTLGLLVTRCTNGAAWWEATHEIGVLAIGLTLVGIGVLGRLRATTLAGAGSLVVYVASLVLLVHVPDQLQNVAVYLMTGGGVLFGTAVLLSVYRDRVLAIPERVRNGEGVFAVLKWR